MIGTTQNLDPGKIIKSFTECESLTIALIILNCAMDAFEHKKSSIVYVLNIKSLNGALIY